MYSCFRVRLMTKYFNIIDIMMILTISNCHYIFHIILGTVTQHMQMWGIFGCVLVYSCSHFGSIQSAPVQIEGECIALADDYYNHDVHWSLLQSVVTALPMLLSPPLHTDTAFSPQRPKLCHCQKWHIITEVHHLLSFYWWQIEYYLKCRVHLHCVM